MPYQVASEGRVTTHRTKPSAIKEYFKRYHKGDREIILVDTKTGATVRRYSSKTVSPAKRNPLTVGLPRNKWVNARVRVTSGGKIQATVDENVLGNLLGKSKNKRKRATNKRKRTARRKR